MPYLPRRNFLLAAAMAAAPAHPAAPALTLVANFDQQVTGVAVARSGRIFVSFPRWEQDVPVSLAELGPGGALIPYPDPAWNSWTNLKQPSPLVALVCVRSLTIDPQGFLWVLDTGAPAAGFVMPGAAKLLKIDLVSNRVVLVLRFDPAAAPQGCALADLRVAPDGAQAFVADSGLHGAILVVDVPSGKTRRLLDGDSRTQAEPGVIPMADGRELRRPDNRPLTGAARGLAVDAPGRMLYWQALAGRTLYRVPTAALADPALPPARVSTAVERVGQTHVAEALWMDDAGSLAITDPANDAITLRAPDGTMITLIRDERLRWPTSLAQGADGALYVTASHLPDMAQFHDKGTTRTASALWKIARPKA